MASASRRVTPPPTVDLPDDLYDLLLQELAGLSVGLKRLTDDRCALTALCTDAIGRCAASPDPALRAWAAQARQELILLQVPLGEVH